MKANEKACGGWCNSLLRPDHGSRPQPGSAPSTLSRLEPWPNRLQILSSAHASADILLQLKEIRFRRDRRARRPDRAQKAEPIITEIYADQTVFDSGKSIGIFTGHVVVTDPRFNIQGDKLTIFISKGQNEGFEKAIVEGNVGVVRDRPSPSGGPPDRMVGRSDKAVYTAKDGRFELTGNPRVQQGLNTHVATSPDTVMILNEAGQLETHGPSRTEIRQDPNAASPTPKP